MKWNIHDSIVVGSIGLVPQLVGAKLFPEGRFRWHVRRAGDEQDCSYLQHV
jgi:hypothetical protein